LPESAAILADSFIAGNRAVAKGYNTLLIIEDSAAVDARSVTAKSAVADADGTVGPAGASIVIDSAARLRRDVTKQSAVGDGQIAMVINCSATQSRAMRQSQIVET
jgi:hypothetical protein